jgi:long-chain acyl-CoA synthetase
MAMNLGETLAAATAKVPGKIAVSCGEEQLTYAELDERSTQLAHGLREAGIAKGDRVALHMGNTLEMTLGYFACFKLGAIAVPLNIRLKPAEIEYVLAHSEARLYLGEPGLYARTSSTPRSCPADRFYETTGRTPTPGFAAFASLLASAGDRPLPRVQPEDPAAILYTSGTTARPKGVTHSHDTLQGCAGTSLVWGVRPDDVFLTFSPLAHASGLLLMLLPAMLLAAEVALVPRFDPGGVLQTLERRRCTVTFGLPAALQALCRELAKSPFDVGSLRLCSAGGDTVSLALQKEFEQRFGVSIQEGVGMTESVPICLNRPGRIRAGSVGEPADGMEVRLVDETGSPVQPGTAGELIVRTAARMTGYWHDAEATAATVRDGWLYTGDLARVDEDGYYWFAGRKKEIIVRGGSNVAPQEVEEVLLQHPAVFQAGVVGMPDPELGESVVAFVSLRDDGGGCCESELIDHARRFLSEHKVPGKVHFLADMPLGTTGKVSRKRLRESLQEEAAITRAEACILR